MGKPKKSDRKKNSEAKINAQLHKAFKESYELLEEEEKKLSKCQKQLEEARAKLRPGNHSSEQLALKEKELAEITNQLKETSEQKYALEKKVEKLILLNETLLKEKEELQRAEQNTEPQSDDASESEIESLKEELRQSGKEKEALLKQLEEARTLQNRLKLRR
jgi:hypothetical protein